MKRKGNGKDQLTGGSEDVNPQYMTFSISMSAANTYTEQAIATPVPRNKVSGNNVTVMEILKVFFDLSEADANPAAGGSVITESVQLTTRSQANFNSATAAVFAFCQKQIRGAFTAAGSYGMQYYDPYVWDCTDGAGHGVIVATDNIYIGMTSAGFVALATCNVKLLYRMKDVTLPEYIGIVQSQQ